MKLFFKIIWALFFTGWIFFASVIVLAIMKDDWVGVLGLFITGLLFFIFWVWIIKIMFFWNWKIENTKNKGGKKKIEL